MLGMRRTIGRRIVVVGVFAALVASLGSVAASTSASPPKVAEAKLVAEAKANVKQWSSGPSPWAINKPLSRRPPRGKVIYFLQCGLPICQQYGNFLVAPAKALGWKLVVVNAGLTPETTGAAYAKAAQALPSGILGAAAPVESYVTQLAIFRKHHIPYVQVGANDPPRPGITGTDPSDDDFQTSGAVEANWVVADSNGKANTVQFSDPSYTFSVETQEGFDSAYERLCPGCALDQQQVSVLDIGTTLPGQVVSYVQSHPSVKYLVFTLSDLTPGVGLALKNAGLLNRIKIVSRGASPLNFANIKAGLESMAVAEMTQEGAYVGLDTLARYFVGDPGAPFNFHNVLRHQIIDAANIKDLKNPNTYWGAGNIVAHFQKLWRLTK
jgi:hypothetical protein